MHEARAPKVPTYAMAHSGRTPGWWDVAADPAPFLSLGLVSPAWLHAALPTIVEAEAAIAPEGSSLAHWDIRSDNMCFGAGGVKLVDWAEACLSNPDLDTGFWLPSLAFEGGPPPEEILPGRPDIAAWVSGFFAARAGLPIIPDAPRVRKVQREQLSAALPRLVRSLRLDAI
jgi:hypothetical protein